MLQVNLNNYNFNYVENGKGDSLVFVHGSASDYRTWDKQLEYFGKYFHTIAYSRRHHWPNEQIQDNEDYSMAKHVADLEEFLKFIENQPIHLVAHSYGALLCILLAIKKPQLIRTLTLAEPPAVALYVSNTPKPKEILTLLFSKPQLALGIIKFGAKGIAPTTKAFKQNDMDKALDIFGKTTLGVKAFLNLSKSRLEQARSNLFKAELLGSGFLPLDKNKIRNITLPTFLISGENSPKLWQDLLVELNKLIPNSELKIIPEASHIMHEDNVSNYNTTVLSFLKKNTK
ncbi:alpha/beta hydrolase [Aequorivita sp. F47161]|uniref:Alpha/beta hydrolase n=1 Tax=Aequorivita vitellina TaxID=2874475 RepID=A0A9X1QXG4_9FLAO|nr:alpha/beta hydrolase [Aequorivita vitellina]MCG2420075.1 alpha/beta hydrolase [Aequorivita vitellina]